MLLKGQFKSNRRSHDNCDSSPFLVSPLQFKKIKLKHQFLSRASIHSKQKDMMPSYAVVLVFPCTPTDHVMVRKCILPENGPMIYGSYTSGSLGAPGDFCGVCGTVHRALEVHERAQGFLGKPWAISEGILGSLGILCMKPGRRMLLEILQIG